MQKCLHVELFIFEIMRVKIGTKQQNIFILFLFHFSVATLSSCVRYFKKATRCSTVEAIEAATLHPALLLGIADRKGTLDYDTDADFVFLDDDLNVKRTFIAGDLVWDSNTGFRDKLS